MGPRPRSEAELRDHLVALVLRHACREPERRAEALQDFMGLAAPDLPAEQAGRLAELVPPLLPELYEKWAGMFAERLLETVDRKQVEELCDGTAAGDAAALLVFVMFLESERMERQMAQDLARYGLVHSDDADAGLLVAAHLRRHMKGPAAKCDA